MRIQKRGRSDGLQLNRILVIEQRRDWENQAIGNMEGFFCEMQFYQPDQMNGKRCNAEMH